ncbi:hypothetical protein WJX72_008261 [[Myrmecia] bisecta]|uniref:Uncharacterized protein n=1 Tax=[Myrmecia] bisecta TaxID=41462 RepID=A0AAW1Q2L8_9CHLO
MATGQNEWRNIQDIVRYTFQAFHEVLRTHGEAINSLESTLEDKASRKELADGLHARVSAKDLTARLKKVEAQVATKVGPDALEAHRIDIGAALQLHTAAVQSQLDQKANDAELQDLRAQQAKTSERLQHLETQLRGHATFDDAIADIRTHAAATSASTTDRLAWVEAELTREADRHHKALLAHKADLAALHADLAMKADGERVSQLSASQQETLATLRRQLEAKAEVADMCALLDAKANVEDVNKALLEVSDELSRKIASDELQRALQDKLASPSSVCSDCCLGRWLWKTSKTKSGGAVPWNVQSVNSDPVNLVWEQDKVSIMVVVPGLGQDRGQGFLSLRKL